MPLLRVMSVQRGRPAVGCEHVASQSTPQGPAQLSENEQVADVYVQAAQARVLTPAYGRLRLGLRVVHESYGLGTVSEVGPINSFVQYVTVDFAGDGLPSEVRADRLFLPDFGA